MSTGFTTLAPAGRNARSLAWLFFRKNRDFESTSFASIGTKNRRPARVGYDPNTIAIRQRLIGEQGSDIKQLRKRICAHDSSLSEQCIDSDVRGRD